MGQKGEMDGVRGKRLVLGQEKAVLRYKEGANIPVGAIK